MINGANFYLFIQYLAIVVGAIRRVVPLSIKLSGKSSLWYPRSAPPT